MGTATSSCSGPGTAANRVVPVHFDKSYQDDSIMKWASKMKIAG